MVNACKGGEIEASSLSRLLPEYDRGSARKALRKYVSDGVLRSRTLKGLRMYSLDPTFPHWRPLRRLLDAIAKEWPHYRTLAAVEDNLRSDHTRARCGI